MKSQIKSESQISFQNEVKLTYSKRLQGLLKLLNFSCPCLLKLMALLCKNCLFEPRWSENCIGPQKSSEKLSMYFKILSKYLYGI